MMRIITGSARGTKLETLEGMQTRPTSERVKEAIFSTIQFEIEGRKALDLFSGSGQMGLEALSRGASRADLIDASSEAIEVIKRNAKKTGLFSKCRILCVDYMQYLKSNKGREKYDIVFLDPPYLDSADVIRDILSVLNENDIVNPNGIVICESSYEKPLENDGFNVRKHSRYGRSYVTVLERKQAE